MQKRIIAFLFFTFAAIISTWTTQIFAQRLPFMYTQSNIQQLIDRVLPGKQAEFEVDSIAGTTEVDIFEIQTKNNKIVLRGNSASALAVALNTYLKEIALISYDWQAIAPIKYPKSLPRPSETIKRSCQAKERFFNNTCTFGYTFPYWNWEQWQRFIDWMAMNGVNRPLLQTGQEAVWLEVWKSFGMSENEILGYFSSPAHLPWHRMANMDKWGGPLPLSYINKQKLLQKKILQRCRSLGMKPVLSAFAGHVPPKLIKLYPSAKITRIEPGWGGMDAQYTTYFLDPKEALFTEIQHRFLKKQRELYGTDHLYSTDPFNEITPPSWEPDYLASVGKTIYESMATTDSLAVWYQMSWTFYYDQKNWTQPRLKAMIDAVPKGKLVFLDYVCEEVEYFRSSDNFHGAPFIWCYLGNFGGNTHIVAPINKVLTRINNIPKNSGCYGVGSTLEGINVNPVIYEAVLGQPWLNDNEKSMDNIILKYANRRSGMADPAVQKAWKTLANEVLVDSATGIWNHSIIFQVSPVTDLSKRFWSTDPGIPYSNASLLKALLQLREASPAAQKQDAYQFDLVNMTRQWLGNYGMVLYRKMMQAYEAKDLEKFTNYAADFIKLGEDIDQLLGTRHEFLLGSWLNDAESYGDSPVEKAYFQKDAREIITTWHKTGGGLTDYSNRQWNGLLKSYYLGRWGLFIQQLTQSLTTDTPFNEEIFSAFCTVFEKNWVESENNNFLKKPTGNAVQLANQLIDKYKKNF